MPSVLLDTRTPYQSDRPNLGTTNSDSLIGSAEFTFFQRLVNQLVVSGYKERDALRKEVIARLRESRDPMKYVEDLLSQCVIHGGPDGLDIAIDVLSQFGDLVADFARAFHENDVRRWGRTREPTQDHVPDDYWYVLLRSAALSDLNDLNKFILIRTCAIRGPVSVREAAVHALGDIGGPQAVELLRKISESELSPMVRESAAEVLGDLEG